METKDIFLSFDIGGTTIKYALVDNMMNLLLHDSIPTENNRDNHIVKTLKDIVAKLKHKYNIKAIGISTAGIVNSRDGSIKYANHLIPGYIGTPLKQVLESEYNMPVYVINDVQAALLGEMLQSGVDDKTFCLTLGTGIGGAFFYKGSIYHGNNDYENYIGHLSYDPTSKTTWEQRCSTISLEKKVRNLHQMSVPEAFSAAKTGNKVMQEVIDDWIEEIAKGIANIILLLDPSTILIGGGVSKQNDYIIPILQEKLAIYLPKSFLKVNIKTPSSWNDNALLGALYPLLKKE